MKRILTIGLLLAFFLFTQNILAQEAEESGLWPHGLTAKILFIDYGTPNSNSDLNISNGIEIAYVRNIKPFLNFAVPAKAGVANIFSNESKTTILSLDGLAQLQYYKEGNKFIPYFMAGLGAVKELDGITNVQIPIGAGLNIKVGEGGYGTLQLEYRKSLEEERDNLQLGVGWHFRLGNANQQLTDSDGDGIMDKDDKCPNVPGVATAYGCPDQDGDGLADAEDDCPEVAGSAKLNGCPDTDKDGIADNKDKCPETPGVAENDGCPEKPSDRDGDGVIDTEDECPDDAGTLKGCPDTDGDGLADKDDKCPEEAGEIEREGCPAKDSDGDGILDEDDECPDVPGVIAFKGCVDSDGDGLRDPDDQCPNAAGPRDTDGCPDQDADGIADKDDECPEVRGPSRNNGCPDIKKEDQETLEFAAKAVQFETGKSNLKAESYKIMEQIVDIMNRYDDYNLKIEGHTDNVGRSSSNQTLSEERAKACYEYLVARGISPVRLTYRGYGETQPIASNDTKQGRDLNRRVTFDLVLK